MTKEIDETLKHALRSFSCKRAIGLEDSQMLRKSPAFSEDDDDDSLNFLEVDDLASRRLGPVIAEKDKPTVTQVFEKMGLLWQQKAAKRVSALQKWRLLRMSERLQQLRRHSAANLKLMGVFKKHHGAFYQIVAFSKGMNLNLEYSSLPRPDHQDYRSHIDNGTHMNDLSSMFNNSEIFETGDYRLNEELRSRLL